MSIFKSILKPFIDFKDDEAVAGKAPEQNTPQEPSVPQEAALSQPAPSGPVPSSTASPSQYKQHFEDLIEQANASNPLFQGTDFKEFIDSKSDVEGITDEASRYKTAFNVLKRAGLTKEKLELTGREYIKIIDGDLKAFESVYVQQFKTQVEQKQQLLEQKSRELQALNEKIKQLNLEISQADKEIVQSRDQLTNNKTAFVAAGENKKREIEGELVKIQQYFS